MHAGDVKFTVTVTLDSNGVYELTGKAADGQGLKLGDIRNALQWALNRANDEMIAGMINNSFKALLATPK
jgi:hypothetical protein